MLSVYPAIVHEEDGVWIEFPDLKGCQSCAETLEEAMKLAQEALGLYLASLADRKLTIPPASRLSEISCSGAQTSYIAVDFNLYRKKTRAVKRMVSLPEWMAEEADDRNWSLSKTLQAAIEAKLEMA